MMQKSFLMMLCYTLIFVGCMHKPIHDLDVIADSKLDSLSIFKDGIYKQKITVDYFDQKTKENKNHTFDAYLKKTKTELYMYCYIGFGITLFKLKDNFIDPVVFTASNEQIEKNKEFFLKIYPLLKDIILLKKNDPRAKLPKMTLTMRPENFDFDVVLSRVLINGVPKELTIENKEHFKFFIETISFEPISNL